MKYKNWLQKLLYDEVFWEQYKHYTLAQWRLKRLREYRSKWKLPWKTIITNFIIEDYKPITKDPRPVNEIALELVSPVP